MPTDDETEGRLETMQPAPDWEPEARSDVIDTLGDETLRFRVWGGDWCPDCREQLPAFAAALTAAGVPDERVHTYQVTRTDDGKEGPLTDEFDVERIPTVVVERDGKEVARFVERSPLPIAETLTRALDGSETGID